MDPETLGALKEGLIFAASVPAAYLLAYGFGCCVALLAAAVSSRKGSEPPGPQVQ